MDLGTCDRPAGWPKLISYLFWAKNGKNLETASKKVPIFCSLGFQTFKSPQIGWKGTLLHRFGDFLKKPPREKALKFYSSFRSKMMIFAFRNSLFETRKILSLSSVWGQNSPKWPTFCRCRRPDQIAEGNLTIFSYTIIVPWARRWRWGCLFLSLLSIPLG